MFVPILITCTHLSQNDESDRFLNRLEHEPVPLSEGKPVGLILEGAQAGDFGLAIYRNSLTRDLVVRFYNGITFSEEITNTVLKTADKYSIPPALAFALCGVESRFDTNAVGYNEISVDRGLFQLNSLSFPELAEADFFSLETNTEEGLKHLRYCLDRGENEVVALAMYNAGEGQVSFVGAPMRTLNYISDILHYRDELENRFREVLLEKLSS